MLEIIKKDFDNLAEKILILNRGIIKDAFHGTSHDRAKSIVKNGFKISQRPGYLGKGIYFFETNPEAAKIFAKSVKSYYNITIIQAVVEMKYGIFYNSIVRHCKKLKKDIEDICNTKLEWGDFMMLLRKIFEEEKVRYDGIVWHYPMDRLSNAKFAVISMVIDPKQVKHCKIFCENLI